MKQIYTKNIKSKIMINLALAGLTLFGIVSVVHTQVIPPGDTCYALDEHTQITRCHAYTDTKCSWLEWNPRYVAQATGICCYDGNGYSDQRIDYCDINPDGACCNSLDYGGCNYSGTCPLTAPVGNPGG